MPSGGRGGAADLAGSSTGCPVGPVGAGGQVVAAAGGPVAVAVSQSVVQAVAQGQCVGRCRTRRRPVVARRAGTVMMRRRSVAQRAVAMPAAMDAARARLNDRAAKETQAALAA